MRYIDIGVKTFSIRVAIPSLRLGKTANQLPIFTRFINVFVIFLRITYSWMTIGDYGGLEPGIEA